MRFAASRTSRASPGWLEADNGMKYIVAGFGRFGRLAVARLKASDPRAEILVLDPKADFSQLDGVEGIHALNENAVSFLVQEQHPALDDVIIPMVPFHLAAFFLLESLSDLREIQLPPAVESMVPNPYRVNESTLCASLADFLCPDDCPEGDVCTVTGEPRDHPLHSLIGDLKIPDFTVVVQRSHQILPGIGGYLVSELFKLRDHLPAGRIMAATSCKCHAVMTAVET